MIDLFEHYNRIKGKPNIFIYSVLGRTSSTALQRILNSSNEICIFGESHGVLTKSLDLLARMEEVWDLYGEEFPMFRNSFISNKHNVIYPNPLNLEGNIVLLKMMIANLFNPGFKVERIGFKDIELDDLQTIEGINRFFPNSQVVFLFRNPTKQFESVRVQDYWPYCHDIDLFMDEYTKLSERYMDYDDRNPNSLFIENSVLYDLNRLRKLLEYLNVGKIDESLIDDRVFASEGKTSLEPELIEKITGSDAWKTYKRMQKRIHF
uniref:Sulfotransferase family protein n=1 Tax=Candidatus Kentrum eta TaxID=2126337 RepID=A0A450UN41_9GAMM|nr:MAG: hypothetical protein BECKH772A_GA0070896_100644 [Candidatus Kentron sp. H]VFJ94707.1 MAG: hypothetical protein BECKH772B_GA0070898_100664 [Candidatus Kentron sp. H]VFK01332.1 MAG: hypothetical protein BECKH772C_GA0070978_100633 [Candidatus Kentron sp. H]